MIGPAGLASTCRTRLSSNVWRRVARAVGHGEIASCDRGQIGMLLQRSSATTQFHFGKRGLR